MVIEGNGNVSGTGRPTRKARLKAKHPERYAEIVRVATRLFSTDGYGSANVNRVAAEVGVGVGTLYSHFDDKDDLFLACVEEAAATDLRVKEERIDKHAPALEMVRAIMRVDRELHQLDPDGQQLLKSVFYGINSHLEVAKAAQAMYLGSIQLVTQALTKGIEEGVFDLRGDVVVAALLLTGLMETFHVLGGLLGETHTNGRPHPADRALTLLCEGILARPAATKKETP